MDLTIRILQVLVSGEHRKNELYDLADPADVDAALAQLTDEGLIRRVGKFGPARFAITAKGRKLLETSPESRPETSGRLLTALTADRRLVLIELGNGNNTAVQIIGRDDTASIEALLKKAA